jgi:elongation factor P--beta-lysine ligase
MNLFKAISIGFTVLKWYESASADDQITAKEITELLATVATSEAISHLTIEL